jgi:protease IV
MKFLKMLLATIIGFFISCLILLFILLGIIGAIVSSGDKEVEIKTNSILKLTFTNEIVDRAPDNLFEGLEFFGYGNIKRDGLNEIIENISKAKYDKNIKGIYLELSDFTHPFVTIDEIRNALVDFKTSGKFIIAYSDFYTQGAYYLASVANKVYLNPEGGIDFHGLHSEITFIKGTLDKLGIEPQIIRHGKYKSAVEPLMSDKMSPENKVQMSTLLNSIWDVIVKNIYWHRDITDKQLNILANNLTLYNADSCLHYKAVDSLMYKDQVNIQLINLSGIADKKPEFVGFSKYSKVPKLTAGKEYSRNKIAIVFAQGDVVMGNSGEGDISCERISKALFEARTDSSVKAIVFRINSPGGSALASEVIWREVSLASKVKPVVASMGDLAASGGYYIACAADTIIANPGTITGSIGVFGFFPNAKQFLNQKLGITTDAAVTNDHSDFPTISRPMKNQEKRIFQSEVDKIYSTFVRHVSEGRHMDKSKVDEIAQGRVWAGADAKSVGLVDTFGGLTDAVLVAAKMAKLKKYRITELPRLEAPLDRLIEELSDDIKMRFIKEELGNEYKYIIQYRNILRYQGIQARIPFEIDVY